MEDQAERKLILIRHSMPQIIPNQPANQWHLSDEGRRLCEGLAERLVAYKPRVIVTSLESKAIETGQIVAHCLGMPSETAPGLHEHERPVARFFATKEQFEAQVSQLFKQPQELVFGKETADQAHDRFAKAIGSVLEMEHGGDLAVVTHGTVMTLFVARAAGIDPVPFWKQLGLPAFVVLSLPALRLEVVENVAPGT